MANKKLLKNEIPVPVVGVPEKANVLIGGHRAVMELVDIKLIGSVGRVNILESVYTLREPTAEELEEVKPRVVALKKKEKRIKN
jgi:hypothetical protein